MTLQRIGIGGTVLVLLTVLSGCQSESAIEADFGNSVRHVVQQQINRPDLATNPSPDAVDQTDAGRLEGVFRSYQGDISPGLKSGDGQRQLSIGKQRKSD